jgi:hypothetical protein
VGNFVTSKINATAGVSGVVVTADSSGILELQTSGVTALTVDGSQNITLAKVLPSASGGTGNGFTKFTGPTTSEKTFTLPDSSQTLLYSGGALGTPASGNLSTCTGIPESNFKNIIINGGFTINQRVYVSAATLAAGAYGHDRWKAGAGGGDYSFTQLASNTTITIAANKTLIQVIEDKNVFRTTYTLSWTGTAQARYAINSATPAGSYAASPIVITGQTVGTTMSVEFNAGTLGNVDLEPGSIATAFPFRAFSTELALCQRYFYSTYDYGVSPGTSAAVGILSFIAQSNNVLRQCFGFPCAMRTTPTATIFSYFGTSGKVANAGGSDVGTVCTGTMSQKVLIAISDSGTGFTPGAFYLFHFTALAEL